MLDQKTKHRIDTSRQILVGKVPDPKAQVEQITTALIYKFMDDMDKEAMELGGDAKFFSGEYSQYSWTKLLDNKLSGQNRLDLYVQALSNIPKNPDIPELFRNIFKGAFLPFRDPRTLTMFLKEINEFKYDNSENLGNAFEYLLSIMGSQGDAGQFRTPRHIIDFIIEIIDPKKNETILDPACGTAGFLISAFKHILKQHDGKDDLTGKITNKEKLLTPDEKITMMNNFAGYDISPDMVKLSLVNLYLHGFPEPKIEEYDTLSSEKKWDETFDVIVANPPFMTPKGGIQPHKRFSVQAKRAEVLFVDYIAEHLSINGRAGIIVPEGIIFQSSNAYKSLRKNLVENWGLYAVVSLPAGVFQPYSGVKTSILFLDKNIAKKTNNIIFAKVENDGFELGAQRRLIDKNDLPVATKLLQKFKQSTLNNQELKEEDVLIFNASISDKKLMSSYGFDLQADSHIELSQIINKAYNQVTKKKVSKNGDYDFSANQYLIETDYANTKWPMVKLEEVCEIKKGTPITRSKISQGNIPVIAGGQQAAYNHNKSNREGQTITCSASGAYAGFLNYFDVPIYASDCTTINSKNENKLLTKFVFKLLKFKQENIYNLQKGMGQPHIYRKDLINIKIPLPPIKIQKKIVKELCDYQKIIDGAKQVVINWKPKININSKWKKIKLKKIGKVRMCKRIFKDQTNAQGEVPFYKIGTFGQTPNAFITQELFDDYKSKFSYPNKGDVLISTSGTIGRTVIFNGKPAYFQDSNIVWIENDEKIVSNKYLHLVFQSINWITTKGGTIERLYNKLIEETDVLVPSIKIQKQIVQKIEAERTLVDSTKKLIDIYEKKAKEVIEKVWRDK